MEQQQQPQSTANPLNLTTEYTWQAGDTLMLIAYKYRRPGQWTELLDLNATQLSKQNYRFQVGDKIKVPEDWFPLPPPPSFSTKFTGSKGTRI